MSANTVGSKAFRAQAQVPDPGALGTIVVEKSLSICKLVSATAETRTLGRPTKEGVLTTLQHYTDGGDITLTVTGGYNEDGDTTFTFSDAGQFLTLVSLFDGTNFFWRKIADYVTGNVTPTELGYLSGVTAGTGEASKALVPDANGRITLPLTNGAPGAGTAGTGTVLKTSVTEEGGIITTRILIDLTGLNGGGTGGDVIGTDGAGVAYLGQITAAKNGTILGGRMQCLETPAGSNVDVDLWSADEATGVEDTAISALSNEVQLINHGNWAAGEVAGLVLDPLVNQYLYLTSGAATAGTFTAGRFLIEFWGYDA